jgi:hypothetical protein
MPELLPLDNAPANARFFVEQSVPGMGAIPLAYYENGPASISQSSTPEPGTLGMLAAGVLTIAALARKRS